MLRVVLRPLPRGDRSPIRAAPSTGAAAGLSSARNAAPGGPTGTPGGVLV